MREKQEFSPRYSEALNTALGALRSPVMDAPGAFLGFFQALSLGQSLTSAMLLQISWQLYVGTLDRKAAFLVASFGIYIAVIALTATVVLGALAL